MTLKMLTDEEIQSFTSYNARQLSDKKDTDFFKEYGKLLLINKKEFIKCIQALIEDLKETEKEKFLSEIKKETNKNQAKPNDYYHFIERKKTLSKKLDDFLNSEENKSISEKYPKEFDFLKEYNKKIKEQNEIYKKIKNEKEEELLALSKDEKKSIIEPLIYLSHKKENVEDNYSNVILSCIQSVEELTKNRESTSSNLVKDLLEALHSFKFISKKHELSFEDVLQDENKIQGENRPKNLKHQFWNNNLLKIYEQLSKLNDLKDPNETSILLALFIIAQTLNPKQNTSTYHISFLSKQNPHLTYLVYVDQYLSEQQDILNKASMRSNTLEAKLSSSQGFFSLQDKPKEATESYKNTACAKPSTA